MRRPSFLKSRRGAYFYVFLSLFLWATLAAVSKLLLKSVDNIQLTFFNCLFAFFTLLVIVTIQRKWHLIRKYDLTDMCRFALMGLVGIFLYHFFLFAALRYSSAQEAFIVNYTWPLWIVVFAAFILKERFSLLKSGALALGFLGIVIIVSQGRFDFLDAGNWKGDIFALLGAGCWALFSVLGRKYSYDRTMSMMFYCGFSVLFSLPVLLIFSHSPSISLKEFAGLFWIGGFTSGLGFVFWFMALKYGETSKMSNVIFLTPFLSLVFIYLLLDEKITLWSVAGLIVIIAGIALQHLKHKHHEGDPDGLG